MNHRLNPIYVLSAIIGLIVGWSLPVIIPAIADKLNQSVAVPPFVFYPLFVLLIITVTWMSLRQTRELHREAVAREQGASNLWITLVFTVIIGVLGYCFVAT